MRRFINRLLNIFRTTRLEREFDEELEFHREMRIQSGRRRGLSEVEAEHDAKRRLGSLPVAKEGMRDARKSSIESIGHDVRFGLRALSKTPRFTIAALLTIVLAVGGVTTVFTLVHSILLNPLPYPESDRIVRLWETQPGPLGLGDYVAAADLADWRKQAQSFESIAAYNHSVYTMNPDTAPYRLEIWRVTPDFFQVLGIEPLLGRGLVDEDELPESPSVAVIGYSYWQTHFGGSPDVLGKTIYVPSDVAFADRSFTVTVVGVMPPDFRFVGEFSNDVRMWRADRPRLTTAARRFKSEDVIAKLRPGVSIDAANAELKSLSEQLAAAYPDTNRDRTAGATFLLEDVVENVHRVLWIFFAAVGFVLLIAIGNLTNLQLVRNTARDHEMHVRAALGASRSRLVRQLVTEALLLSTAGCALGLFVGWAGVKALLVIAPTEFPRTHEIGLNVEVLLFAVGISYLTGLIIGLLPAWRASRIDLRERVSAVGRSATMSARAGRLQRTLIVSETALALVLLVAAGLLINSVWRLLTTDAGMNEENLWVVEIAVPDSNYSDEQYAIFWNRTLESIRALSQVESAAGLINSPSFFDGNEMTLGAVMPTDQTGDPFREGINISNRRITPDYFRTLGIPILKGRPILESDTGESASAVVLNEMAARLLWPGEDAVGKRIGPTNPQTVIGIVPDFKLRSLGDDISPQLYQPYSPGNVSSGSIIVLRAKPDTENMAAAVQTIVANLDSKATVSLSSLGQIRWAAVATERFRTGILLIFALTATFLAIVGIFGVVSYGVIQRQREIGLRMALGAAQADVVRLMLRQAMTPAMIGFAIGLCASFALTRLLSDLLYEVAPTDPLTFLLAFVVMSIAALIASFLPARRAAHVDPMVSLRYH